MINESNLLTMDRINVINESIIKLFVNKSININVINSNGTIVLISKPISNEFSNKKLLSKLNY